MTIARAARPDRAAVLGEALLGAGKSLGMTQADLGQVIGKDRSAISRGRIAPDTKAGELALLLIRCYRALYALVGGDPRQMRHWMHTPNLHTGGIPAEQVKTVSGLAAVLEYLDGMRGKLQVDLWQACGAEALLQPVRGTLRRLVESQEQIATSRLVSSLERQAMLEEMLEATKPPVRAGTGRLHYLLATPFRYPPLRHGSRFGTRADPSLLYGSLSVPTVLAEAAYYRFVFWHGMQSPPPAPLVTQHTLFAARYRSAFGVRLHLPPCNAHRAVLTDPTAYGPTQTLGTAMRSAGVEAFEFTSARDPGGGVNVALFAPGALASARPSAMEPWLCETSGEHVRFLARGGTNLHEFPVATFLVNGHLPHPAL